MSNYSNTAQKKEEKKTEVILGGNRRPYQCLILGGGYEYISFFHEMGFFGAKTLDEAAFVLFTGGEDVDPMYYDEPALKGTFYNTERDRREKVVFDLCVEKSIPMVGICRGGQFLNVMNGGKMWQDVNNHCGNHMITEVLSAERKKEPRVLSVTSTHHQMMIPSKEGTVLAIGVDSAGLPICTERITYGREFSGTDAEKYPDYEVIFYEDTATLCFQPHPEFKNAPEECKDYFEELLEDYILPYA